MQCRNSNAVIVLLPDYVQSTKAASPEHGREKLDILGGWLRRQTINEYRCVDKFMLHVPSRNVSKCVDMLRMYPYE